MFNAHTTSLGGGGLSQAVLCSRGPLLAPLSAMADPAAETMDFEAFYNMWMTKNVTQVKKSRVEKRPVPRPSNASFRHVVRRAWAEISQELLSLCTSLSDSPLLPIAERMGRIFRRSFSRGAEHCLTPPCSRSLCRAPRSTALLSAASNSSSSSSAPTCIPYPSSSGLSPHPTTATEPRPITPESASFP